MTGRRVIDIDIDVVSYYKDSTEPEIMNRRDVDGSQSASQPAMSSYTTKLVTIDPASLET